MKKKINDWYELINFYFETTKEEKEWEVPKQRGIHWTGKKHHRERIRKTAEWAAKNYEGDIVEIGALRGEQTVHLCEVARKYNRKVIVVDPWNVDANGVEEPLNYMSANDYQIFLEVTKDYSDVLEVIRKPSSDKEVFDKIENRQLCFAWGDGCHTSKGLINDLTLVKHCGGVVGIDDISYFQWCNVCKQHYSLYSVYSDFAAEVYKLEIHFSAMGEGYVFMGDLFTKKPGQKIGLTAVISQEFLLKVANLIQHTSSGPRMIPNDLYRFGGLDFQLKDDSLQLVPRTVAQARAGGSADVVQYSFHRFTKEEL